MSVSSTNVSNALSGISGYDFSGIVDSLVSVYKIPETAMTTKQTALQTTQNAWKDVNTRMAALEATLTGLSDTPTWTATQSTTSNSNVISATTGINASQGVYNIHVTNTAQAQTVSSVKQSATSSTAATTIAAGEFKLTVGTASQTIKVAANASLQDIADSINNAKAGVSATVIQVNDTTGVPGVGYKLAITASKTGTANAASYVDTTGSVLETLGVLTAPTTLNESQTATDAKLTINGITDITSASNTVTSAILGVTLNISGADTTSTAMTTIKVSADNSTAQSKIQGFIDQYNSTMTFIAGKLSYDSTTKIAGDLFGDQTLQGIQERLRGMVTGTLNNPTGPYLTLGSIGISTSGQDYGQDATLTFDSSKFTAAMADNPNSVANLFGATAGGITPSTDSSNTQGLANIMENYLHPMIMYGGSFASQQAGYDTQITALKTEITDFETKATAYQAAQKLKFAALETALSAINNQSSSLTGMINSLNAQTSTK